MNKAKLKSYAPQARIDFIAAVTARANHLGLSEKSGQLEVAPAQTQGDVTVISGQPWPAKVAPQREKLISRMKRDGFNQTCEAIAYTWFNRFAAIRYMELHDYLGHGHRALSSVSGGVPDILNYAADLATGGDSGLPGLKLDVVTEMKLAGNRDGDLYRMLLVAQCNALSRAMPFLFERIDDDSELLLPDNLLRSDSVIAKLVSEIPEEDWAEVEIIGWLYQFYISEKKDEVIGKVVKSEDIPAATQLFTPNWIVQYLVQNSVGRLWLMANPQSTLAKEWPYYITPAEQTPEVQAQLDALIQTRVREDGDTLNPESITVLDPACGSGHILVVAYDVLKAIYLERGYQPRAIPRLILEKNLYGLDIDDRAAQMAGFALLMKARADDRRLFNEPPRLNVLSLQESKGMDAAALAQALNSTTTAGSDFVEVEQLRWLIETFEHAKTFGSLIQIDHQPSLKLRELLSIVQQSLKAGDLYAQAAAQDVLPLVQQALMLGMQFDAVVANPPYMGNKYLAPALKIYLKDCYDGFEKDLFSSFIVRNLTLTKVSGNLGFMSPFVWMFISSYEELRNKLLLNTTLTSLVQLEYSGFDGAVVPICTFTLNKVHVSSFTSSFVRLSDFRGADQQGPRTLEAIQNKQCGWFYLSKPDDFKKIPGKPVAYWVGANIRNLFNELPPITSVSTAAVGLQTGDNDRFMRAWHEVPFFEIGFDIQDANEAKLSKKKWFPYNKGGAYRKWYGNFENVVNWENDGELIRGFKDANGKLRSRPQNTNFYFKKSITWSEITSSWKSFRFSPVGCIYDVKGQSAFFSDDSEQLISLAWLNSNIVEFITKILNPTLSFQSGDYKNIPYPKFHGAEQVGELAKTAISISKIDWDSFETSFNFSKPYLLSDTSVTGKLQNAWTNWKNYAVQNIDLLKKIEETNNNIFIHTYSLQSELSPEVPESQITLARADREKDCQRLISYAVGCMMGRYSLDEPGLIYAHAGNVGFDASRYATFPADADSIIPITDELWFTDDAPSRIREFLRAVWGPDTLEENMAWLAESLGSKASETPDETIRRYIADKFFKDHLQTYKKRPIYWLFSSGKQGAFQALVYLHRYSEGTLARLRAEYVVPLTGKIQSRIEMLQKDASSASSTAARNKLAKEVEKLQKKHVELLAYDEQLRHYADMRITLDLDDGVKVNYGKFGNLLAEVKAVTGGASDD